jgi:hypothetical protein
LASLLTEKSFHLEASDLIRLASKLKRLEFAEPSEEPLGEIGPEDISGTDKWMMTVAHDVAEILGLHSPAFLASSARDKFGRGAYVFSVSNDSGEAVVLKIGLAGEIAPYQKVMRIFGEDPPSVLPRVYAAGYFDDIGYQPPVRLANNFGYVVMEELEPMPKNMAQFLSESPLEGDSFRVLMSDTNLVRGIIEEAGDRIKRTTIFYLQDKGESTEDAEEMASNIIKKIKEETWWGLKKLESISSHDPFRSMLRKILGLSDQICEKILSEYFKADSSDGSDPIATISSGFSRHLTKKINNKPPVDKGYGLDIPLGQKIRSSLSEIEKLGIDPRDLHADNIMLRPETYEIVISDLGHFHV